MQYGWNHPETARYYQAFCELYDRYRDPNEALAAAAALERGQRILDLAAGTGGTAAAVLDALGGECDVVCLEPAEAMRAAGQQQVPQADWVAHWPRGERFDRVVCGAAIWQMIPEAFDSASAALREGGAFVFTIPSQYVGEFDEPGGGADPGLTQLIAHVAGFRTAEYRDWLGLPQADELEGMLEHAGFRPVAWATRGKLTQRMYRDWLKIPVLTDALLPEMSASERAVHIDIAWAKCDAESWRWEAWRGWTAWK